MTAKKLKLKVLRGFEIIERPMAWVLLLAGFGTFVGVVFNLISVGDFKLATLLIAADLTVSGFGAVQESQDDEDIDEIADDVKTNGD